MGKIAYVTVTEPYYLVKNIYKIYSSVTVTSSGFCVPSVSYNSLSSMHIIITQPFIAM